MQDLQPPSNPLEDVQVEEKAIEPLNRPEVTGHVGFIEVTFNHGELPIGLVLDWSMPFPVIAKVLPGSFGSTRSQLHPGLVLIAINKSGLRIRPTRDMVEAKLRMRPLHLVFEAPAPERFDFFSTTKRWKKHLNKARSHPLGQQRPGMSATMNSFFSQSSLMDSRRDSGDWTLQAPPLPSPPPATNMAHSLARVRSSPGALHNSDDMHGAKVPYLRDMRDTVKLPPVIRGGSTLPMLSIWESDPREKQRSKPSKTSWGNAASLAAFPLRQAVSNRSLTWLAAGMAKPDAAYQHLIDEPRAVGPGAPERWPLHHNEMYICRLSDMMLAWRLREAYEVGFRGFKSARPT